MSASKRFYELTDSELVGWANHFSASISLSPETYTLSAANATAYAAAAADYAAKQAAASNADTRGEATIFARALSRDALITITRKFAAVIQAALTVTDEQRQELGLHIRDSEPTNINPPMIAPIVNVMGVDARTFTLRFSNPLSPDSRRRPESSGRDFVFVCGTCALAGR